MERARVCVGGGGQRQGLASYMLHTHQPLQTVRHRAVWIIEQSEGLPPIPADPLSANKPAVASSRTDRRLGIKAHYFPTLWTLTFRVRRQAAEDAAELHVRLFPSLDVGVNLLLRGGPRA